MKKLAALKILNPNEFERTIRETLRQHHGFIGPTAKALEVSERQLVRYMDALFIEPEARAKPGTHYTTREPKKEKPKGIGKRSMDLLNSCHLNGGTMQVVHLHDKRIAKRLAKRGFVRLSDTDRLNWTIAIIT